MKAFKHICWDGCMFPNRGDAETANVELHPERDDFGPGSARMERISKLATKLMKKLNIGLVGYGFMARAHSNAYLSVGQFFDLKYQPVLKAVAARDPAKG